MKLNYDRKSKDPTYFIQIGFRNGKKTSTRNVSRIGKHSELLAQGIEDPLSYARQKVAQANEQQKNGKVSMDVKIDFSEKVLASDAMSSVSTSLGIGYFFLQAVYNQLNIHDFFKHASLPALNREPMITLTSTLSSRLLDTSTFSERWIFFTAITMLTYPTYTNKVKIL